MPTYEYECLVCGNRFEAFHRINAEPVRECPRCGGKVERKISAGTGLLFKGTGFYITDYKKTKADTATPESKPSGKKEQTSKSEST